MPTNRDDQRLRPNLSASCCADASACPCLCPLAQCRYGRQLDQFGHHQRAACSEAGVLGKAGFPLECAAAQVCREAGARVTVEEGSRKAPWRGSGGSAAQERNHTPGVGGEGGRARLVVLAAETGGRWSDETAHFLRSLAKAKAESVPLLLQNRVKAAWLRRWRAAQGGLPLFLSLDRRPNPGTGPPSPHGTRWCGGTALP